MAIANLTSTVLCCDVPEILFFSFSELADVDLFHSIIAVHLIQVVLAVHPGCWNLRLVLRLPGAS